MRLSRAVFGGSFLIAVAACSPFGEAASGDDGADAAAATDADGGSDATTPDSGLTCDERALDFSGRDGQKVTVTGGSAIDLDGSLTVEAWIFPRVANQEMHVVSHHDHDKSQGWALLLKGGKVEMRLYGLINGTAGSENAGVGSPQPYVVAGRWAHIAGTFDGTKLRVYYDGVLRDDTGVPGLVRRSYPGDAYIGRAAYDAQRFWFNGLIDEVRLSKLALYTDSALAKPTQRFAQEPSTLALFHFDEADGPTANDDTMNHPGTLGPTTTAPARVPAPCMSGR